MFSDDALNAIVTEQCDGWPYYSWQNPGMPEPDDVILRAALRLHGEDVVKPKKQFAELCTKHPSLAHTLDRVYARILYDPTMQLSIALKGTDYPVVTLPGHPWTVSSYGPRQPLADPRILVVTQCPSFSEVQDAHYGTQQDREIYADALRRIGEQPSIMHPWYFTAAVPWANVKRKGAIPVGWLRDGAVSLQQTLRLLQPHYIMCLQANALKAVCGPAHKISTMVGKAVDHTYMVNRAGEPTNYVTARVFATPSAADIARNPEKRPEFDRALKFFIDSVYERSGTHSASRRYQYIYSLRDLRAYVDSVIARPGLKRIAIDAEWHGVYHTEADAYVRMIQLSCDGKLAAVVCLHAEGGEPCFSPGIPAAVKELNRLFDRDDVQWIGHFINADAPQLDALGCNIMRCLHVPETHEEMRQGYAGVYDTGAAAHACDETGNYKLEVLCANYLYMDRWDAKLNAWLADQKVLNSKAERKRSTEDDAKHYLSLNGYGNVPTDILGPYSGADVIGTWRLAELQSREGGMLDCDDYGLCSWLPFWRTMRAMPAFLEMHMTGVRIDVERMNWLTDFYVSLADELTATLQREIRWPKFNPKSAEQCREFLFGEQLNGKRDIDGNPIRLRPEGAMTLGLTPVTTTGQKIAWEQVVARGEEHQHDPCTDKEVLGILGHQHPLAGTLRDCRFIRHVISTTVRRPKVDADGNRTYSAGLPTNILRDGRVRTTFYQTKETGRVSSARPNLQVFAKRRESDYARIAGDQYRYPLRSMIASDYDADDPTVLVESDFGGAELLVAATQSRCAAMIEHCMRGQLPEDDPNYYDIHSNIAVTAFALHCPPTKQGLEEAGVKNLRVAAKNVIFGVFYGRGAEALARQCCEEGVQVTATDTQRLIDTIMCIYPELPALQQACRDRVLNQQWMAHAKGRYRRFVTPHSSRDRGVLGNLQRQAMNFPMQGLVADAISDAMHEFYNYPGREALGYKLLLQIHDAVLLEVPVRSLRTVWCEVIPRCMVDAVSFYACDLDGVRVPGSPEYRFSVDKELAIRWGTRVHVQDFARWGIQLSDDDCKLYGVRTG